jgi:predicted ATPase
MDVSRSRGSGSGAVVFGRDVVLRELTEILAPGRLVSIVATGGMGKTTVARELASIVEDDWTSETVWIDLTAAADFKGTVAQISAALGRTLATSDPVVEIATWLRGKDAVLILDCCEPVVESVRNIVDRLLEAVPTIAILTTSREVIGARGEQIFELPPLDMGASSKSITLETALDFPAIELFVNRGAEVSDLVLTETNVATVSRICAKLDGIPLAIELAAAQTSVLGLSDLEMALSAHLPLAPDPNRRATPRHATLHDMLAWSYDRLSNREKAMIERLSVFEGAASLDAILNVTRHTDLPESEIIVLLAALHRKSLLKIERADERNGFRLLDTTRAFARERLSESGMKPEFQGRLARYMCDRAASSRIEGEAPAAVSWFGPVAPNLPNLRSALRWAFGDDAEVSHAVALATASVPLFMQLSLLAESEFWASAGLARIEGKESTYYAERTKLLAYRGAAMLGTCGPVDASRRAMQEAHEAAQNLGEAAFIRLARSALFWLYVYRGEPVEAVSIARQLETTGIDAADPSGDLIAANCIASASTFIGDQAQSSRLLRDVERRQPLVDTGRYMRIGSDPGIFSRVFAIKTLWMLGLPDQAGKLFDEIEPALKTPEHGLYHCYCLNEVMIPMLCQRRQWDRAFAVAAELVEASGRQAMAIRRSSAECATMAIEILKGDGRIGAFEASLRQLRAARFLSLMSWYDWVLAMGLARSDREDEALAVLDLAIGRARQSGDAWWLPELLRCKGETMAQKIPRSSEALSLLQGARSLASSQSSLVLELRAAAACLALDITQAEAADWLKRTLGRLTEGLDDPDIEEARVLLKSRARTV